MHCPGDDGVVALRDVAGDRLRELDALGFVELVGEGDLPVTQDARVAPAFGALDGVGERLGVRNEGGVAIGFDTSVGDVLTGVAFEVVMDSSSAHIYEQNAEAIRDRSRRAMAAGAGVGHHVEVANRHFASSAPEAHAAAGRGGGVSGGRCPPDHVAFRQEC